MAKKGLFLTSATAAEIAAYSAAPYDGLVRTRPRVYSDTVGDSMTQMEHASECDINFQIRRFQGLGINPHQPLNPDQMRDISDLATDFIQAHNVLLEGREAFDELPEHVQQRFSGSPAQFMDFMSDIHNNLDEAVKLGLVELRTPPAGKPDPLAGKEEPKATTEPPKGGSQGSGA